MNFKTITEIAQEEAYIKTEKLVDNYDFQLDGNDFFDLVEWTERMAIFDQWASLDFECDEWEQSRTDRCLTFRLEAFDALDTELCSLSEEDELKKLYRLLAAQITSKSHPSFWKSGLPCEPSHELTFLPKKDLVSLINMASWKIHELFFTKGYGTWKHFEDKIEDKSEDALDRRRCSLALLG